MEHTKNRLPPPIPFLPLWSQPAAAHLTLVHDYTSLLSSPQGCFPGPVLSSAELDALSNFHVLMLHKIWDPSFISFLETGNLYHCSFILKVKTHVHYTVGAHQLAGKNRNDFWMEWDLRYTSREWSIENVIAYYDESPSLALRTIRLNQIKMLHKIIQVELLKDKNFVFLWRKINYCH